MPAGEHYDTLSLRGVTVSLSHSSRPWRCTSSTEFLDSQLPGAVTTLSVGVRITGLVVLQLYDNCLVKVSDAHLEKPKLLREGEKSSPGRKVSGRMRKRRQKSRVLTPE